MNSLNKIVVRNLQLNKKRTLGTIIGIVLSVALICAVSGMLTTFQNTLVKNAAHETGYYHAILNKTTPKKLATLENNRDIANIYPVTELGSTFLYSTTTRNQYGNIFSMNKNTFENLAFQLESGRFPQNNQEIILSKQLENIEGFNYKIGDKITLKIGKLIYNEETSTEELENTIEKTYIIVGLLKANNNRFSYYPMVTTGENQSELSAYIALKKPKTYENSLAEIFGVEKLSEIDSDYLLLNEELLRWECFQFSDSTITMILSVVSIVILIIVLTSIYCIKNAFDISTTEKIKMYGMLASIGATKKQIKHNVITEGLVLGLIGIPLGILIGILAVACLILLVNVILSSSGFFPADFPGLSMKLSMVSILVSIILGFITIYLSALSSAKKASRVSPLEQLRNSADIKLNPKKLKTPFYVKKIFKTGGVIAHKNLKRSKKKYKTTVISLIISIFVFISMSSFITYTVKTANAYYETYQYNLNVKLDDKKMATEITKMKGVDKYTILYESEYTASGYFQLKDQSKLSPFGKSLLKNADCRYDEEQEKSICTDAKVSDLMIIAVDSPSFKDYVESLHLNYNTVKKDGILLDYSPDYKSKELDQKKRIYKYKKNDQIEGTYHGQNLKIEVAKVTDKRPNGLEKSYYNGGYLLVDYNEYKQLNFMPYNMTIITDDSYELETKIKNKYDASIRNIDKDMKQENSVYLVISIFLYGFIIVITLIGVTNIFNTITSNMELRQKEFAMLKSIGMTKKEFNRMINLETLFYSTKALLFGIMFGLLGSYAIYKAFAKKLDFGFQIPYQAIIISITFVFLLVFLIMRYSMNKINKQNIIETIRKENV